MCFQLWGLRTLWHVTRIHCFWVLIYLLKDYININSFMTGQFTYVNSAFNIIHVTYWWMPCCSLRASHCVCRALSRFRQILCASPHGELVVGVGGRKSTNKSGQWNSCKMLQRQDKKHGVSWQRIMECGELCQPQGPLTEVDRSREEASHDMLELPFQNVHGNKWGKWKGWHF